jgi:hypothetical protein
VSFDVSTNKTSRRNRRDVCFEKREGDDYIASSNIAR